VRYGWPAYGSSASCDPDTARRVLAMFTVGSCTLAGSTASGSTSSASASRTSTCPNHRALGRTDLSP